MYVNNRVSLTSSCPDKNGLQESLHPSTQRLTELNVWYSWGFWQSYIITISTRAMYERIICEKLSIEFSWFECRDLAYLTSYSIDYKENDILYKLYYMLIPRHGSSTMNNIAAGYPRLCLVPRANDITLSAIISVGWLLRIGAATRARQVTRCSLSEELRMPQWRWESNGRTVSVYAITWKRYPSAWRKGADRVERGC